MIEASEITETIVASHEEVYWHTLKVCRKCGQTKPSTGWTKPCEGNIDPNYRELLFAK